MNKRNRAGFTWLAGIILTGAFIFVSPSFAQIETASTAVETASTTSGISGRSALLFLGNKNIAPVIYLNGDLPAGVAVDIVHALAQHLSRPVEIRAMDWPEAQKLVASGTADALIQINSTEERKKIYDFSDPLLESHFSIFTDANTVGITGTSSLRGLVVGVEAGGLPQQILNKDPEIKLAVIPNFLEGFKQLNEGSLDAVVVDYRVGSYIIAENNLRNIKVSGEPINPSYSAFAVRKGNTELLDEINQSLRLIKADGTYNKILDDWKPQEVIFQTREQISQAVYYVAISVVSVSLLLAIIWAITIRRELMKRKSAERAEKQAEKYAEKVISSANAMIVGLDAAGKVTVFNAMAEKISGYRKSEVIGRDWFSLVVPRSRFPEVWKEFEEFQKKGKSIVGDFQNPILTKTGGERIIEWRNSDMKDNGNVIGTISYGIDITERKQAEKLLAEERGLFIGGPTAVFKWKAAPGWPVEYVSPNIESQFGYLPQDLMNEKFSYASIVHPDDIARVGAEVEEYNRRKTPSFEQQYRIAHKDGRYRWVDDFTTIIRNNKGEATHFLGYISDITERKLAEEKNLRMAAIVESSDDAIYSKTPDGIVRSWNKGAEKIYGYSAAEMIGQPISVIVPKEKLAELREFNELVKRGERISHVETTRDTKSGRELYISVSLSPIFDDRGQVSLIAAIARDITERKQTEVELDRRNRSLRMLSDTNQALIYISSEDKLLNRICQVIVEIGGYKLAWVGFVEHDAAKTIRPVAQAGFEAGYVKSAKLTWADNDRGRGPGGVAVRTGKHSLVNNILTDPVMMPWRADAVKRGYQSVIALPLVIDDKVFGVLGIYSNEPDAFGLEEVRLLSEFAADLSFGIATLRLRAEHKSLEEELKVIFDNASDGVLIAESVSGKFLRANRMISQMLGYNSEELAKMSIQDIHPTEALSQVFKLFSDLAHEKISLAPNVPVKRKDGGIFYADINASVIVLEGKKYVLGMFRDVTEVKKSQEAMAISETKYRSLFETAKDGIIILDAKTGEINEVNHYLIELLGYGPDEFLRKKIWKIGFFKDVCASEKSFRELKSKGYARYENIPLATKSGREIRIEFVLNVYPADRAGVIQCNLRDVTDNYELAEKISQSEKRYSTLVENSNDAVILIQDGIIKYANPAIKNITNMGVQDIVGKPMMDFIDPKFKKLVADNYQRRLKGEKVENRYEFAVVDKQGKSIPVETNSSTIIFDGRPANMAILRDITHAKRLDRIKSEFISVASHQLRGPLTGIKWYGQLLIDQKIGKLTQKQTDFVKQIYDSNERMIRLVNDLLDVSHIETGHKFSIDKKPGSMFDLANKVVDDMKVNAPGRNIVVELDESYHKKLLFSFDQDKIYQVICNLVNNSIKYSRKGTKVIIGLKRVNDELQVFVKDFGFGIPEYQKDRVFQKFFRADNIISISTEGTGLGLYIVKGIINAHGGRVWFESEQNKGTTFYFALPLKVIKSKT